MTIKNPQAYLKAIWDWKFLTEAGCFREAGPKFEVADLDGLAAAEIDTEVKPRQGIVHRNGHWLLFECKPTGGTPTPGQEWNYTDLVRIGFSIIYLWGEANQPTALQVWKEGCPEKYPKQEPATLDDICRQARRWFVMASKTPSVISKLENHIRLLERQVAELMREQDDQ